MFVAVLGASTYAFARAALGQGLSNWIDCHVRAFDFFQGTTKLIVPDNPRTGVTRACRYEPDLNRTYQEMAQLYGIAIIPARPEKARDKAKVENAVAPVRTLAHSRTAPRKFFSVAELNEAIEELLDRMNQRPFRKREGRRASLYAALDRPALQPFRRSATSWRNGRRCASTSITTSRSIDTITAFPISWSGNSWKPATPPTLLSYSTAENAWSSHARNSLPITTDDS